MENNNNKLNGAIIWGIILSFVIPPLGILLIIIGVIKLAKEQNKEVDLEKDDVTQQQIHAHDFTQTQKYDVSQKQVHAHDFTEVQEDDVTQEQVHAHDAWEDGGPIKYY